MARSGRFVKGTFIGAIIGAVAGLLFAPKAGRETRKDLQKKSQELQGQAQEKTAELTKKAGQAVEQAGRKVQKGSTKAKQKAAAKTDVALGTVAKQARRARRKVRKQSE